MELRRSKGQVSARARLLADRRADPSANELRLGAARLRLSCSAGIPTNRSSDGVAGFARTFYRLAHDARARARLTLQLPRFPVRHPDPSTTSSMPAPRRDRRTSSSSCARSTANFCCWTRRSGPQHSPRSGASAEQNQVDADDRVIPVVAVETLSGQPSISKRQCEATPPKVGN